MTAPTLTPRQKAVLDAIREHIAREGVSPSLGEIAAAVGVLETGVVRHVQALEAKGFIRRPRRSRSIEIVPRVTATLWIAHDASAAYIAIGDLTFSVHELDMLDGAHIPKLSTLSNGEEIPLIVERLTKTTQKAKA